MKVEAEDPWSRRLFLRWIVIALAGLCGGCKLGAAMDASDYFSDDRAEALAEAAASGRTEAAARLLSQGLDVNVRGRDGMTPLIVAILSQNKKGVEFLLQHGADPNLQLSDGSSALAKELPFAGNSAVSFAARHEDIWYLDTVLKYGGNANLVNPFSDQTPIYASIASLRTLQPRRLIAAGANLNYQDRDGVTPLIFAARANRFDLAYDMLMAGADPTIANKWGKTIVNVIKRSVGHTLPDMSQWRDRVIAVLREKGIDVDIDNQ